jgi:hypothetical protein
LPPRPGMPKGGVARLALQIPSSGTICPNQEPELSRDVLHGETSNDVLSGQPSSHAVNQMR